MVVVVGRAVSEGEEEVDDLGVKVGCEPYARTPCLARLACFFLFPFSDFPK